MAYSRAIYHIDLVNGSDAARADLTGCNMTNSGGVVSVNKTGHGLVDGAVVTVPTGTYSGDWLVKRTDADNFTLHTAPATGIITVSGTPVVNETFVIGTQTFTFKASRSGAGEVTISSDLFEQTQNIIKAIQTDSTQVTTYNISDYFSGYRVNVQSLIPGTSGNTLTFSESATGISVDGSGTLYGGANSTYSADRSSVSITPFGGMSWTDAWKTSDSGATAARIAPGDVIRFAKSPDPVSIGNATWNNRSSVVTLASAQTLTVDNCETAWTGNPSGDTTVERTGIGTDGKEGSYSMKFTLDASPQASIMQAYYKISDTGIDFSAYQKLSFWFKNEVAIADDETWYLCLCSDVAGAVVVDTIKIPAIAATAKWHCLTLARNGGGNLGNAIKSIALYIGTTVPTASKYVYLDNIIACTTDGLNLQSLISKTSSAQGGQEAWYQIQSINGVDVVLGNFSVGRAYYNSGLYYGVTETVTTYKRETIKCATQNVQDSGTIDSYIYYQGGYNTSTNVEDGETFLDKRDVRGNSTQWFSQDKKFWSINNFNFVGGNRGFSFTSGTYDGFSIINQSNIIGCGDGSNDQCCFYFGPSSNIQIVKLGFCNNNSSVFYGIGYCSGIFIKKIKQINNNVRNIFNNINKLIIDNCEQVCNNISNVFYGSIINSDVSILEIKYNTAVISTSNSNLILRDCVTSNNSLFSNLYYSKIQLVNCSISEAEYGNFYAIAYDNNEMRSKKHDQIEGNEWIWGWYNTAANLQTSIKHADDPASWKIAITSSRTNIFYPYKLRLIEVYCPSGEQRTITVRIKLDHATNVGAKISVPVQYGISTEVSSVKAANTDWEDVSITFTPSASGVISIYVYAYYLLSTTSANVYVGRALVS